MGFISMHNANEYKDFICSYYVLKSLLDSLLTLRTWSSVRLSTRSSRDSRRETRLSREPTQSSGRTQLYLSKWSSRDSRRDTRLSRGQLSLQVGQENVQLYLSKRSSR